MPKITAAVATKARSPLEFREFQLAEPEGREILVRTVATGICHTDLLARDGIFGPSVPIIPGHEGAGIVEAVGDGVRSIAVGDHVVMTQASCDHCSQCYSAHPMNCENAAQYNYTGVRASGKPAVDDTSVNANFVGQSAFATYILAVESNVVVIPKDYPLEMAAPLGCGMATGAGTVFNVLNPAPRETIVIFGAGAVGLAAVMASKINSCSKIIIIDLNDERLSLAKSLGATDAINAGGSGVLEQVQKMTGGGANYAIDAVGVKETVRSAIECVKPGGKTVLLGANEISSDFTVGLATLILNRTVCGAIIGDQIPKLLIPRLLELAQNGLFPYQQLIQTYSFKDINKAIEDTENGKVVKPVVVFD